MIFPEFEDMRRNGTLELESILLLPTMNSFFKMNFKPLIDFFCDNSYSLISLAVSEKRSDICDSAFNVVTAGHIQLSQIIIDNDDLKNAVLEILTNKNPSDFQLSRVADVISAIFSLDVQNTTKSCDYLYLLLKHVDNLSIYFLFRMLFGKHEELISKQQVFAKMKVPEFIANELLHIRYQDYFERFKIESNSKSKSISDLKLIINNPQDKSKNRKLSLISKSTSHHYFDTFVNDEPDIFCNSEYLKMEAYYRILNVISKNSEFYPYFREETVVPCLLQRLNAPFFVLDAQWECIYSISSLLSPISLQYFFEPASAFFKEIPKAIHLHHYSALMFLGNIVEINSSEFNYDFITKPLLNNILGTLITFNMCTIFHNAVRHFISSSLKNKKVNCVVVSAFTPVLIVEAEIKQYGVVYASAFSILESICSAAISDNSLKEILFEIDSFSEFYDNYFLDHQKLVRADYGGEIVKAEGPSLKRGVISV